MTDIPQELAKKAVQAFLDSQFNKKNRKRAKTTRQSQGKQRPR